MFDSIRLSVDRDDDGTGLFNVEFVSGHYAGSGSAYFDLKHIGAFAQELATFPLPEKPVVIFGGFFDDTENHALIQEHVFLQARALVGGPVGLLVRVAEPWDTSDSLRRSASTEFLLDYEQLHTLSKKLQSLALGDHDDVVLEIGPTG